MMEHLMYISSRGEWELYLQLLAAVAVLAGLATFWIRRRIVRGVYCELLRVPLLVLPLASLTGSIGACTYLIDGFIGSGQNAAALNLLHQAPWLLRAVELAMASITFLLAHLALAIFIVHEASVWVYSLRPRFPE